jgi:hypothetical protein
VGAADPLTLSRSDADSPLLRLLGNGSGGGGGGGGSGGGGERSGERSGESGSGNAGSAVSMWLARLPLMYATPTALLHRGGHGFPSAGVGRGKAVVSAFLERAARRAAAEEEARD